MKIRAGLLAVVVAATPLAAGPLDLARAADVCETMTWDGFGGVGQPLLKLNGDAAVVEERLRVTPAVEGKAGSAFTQAAISLAEDASFSTYFEFQFTEPAPWGGADGLVFVVQTVDNTVGGAGGGIGYRDLPHSVGIEFDNWINYESEPDLGPITNDPNGAHVGIDLNGSLHSDPVEIVTDLNNGEVRHVWVDYDGGTDALDVRIATSSERPADPLLSKSIDLVEEALGATDAFFGFTSATGGAWANHDVLNWQLTSCYAPIQQPSASVTLTADPPAAGLGVVSIPVGNVAGGALADPDTGASPDQIAATPLRSIDLDVGPTTQASPLGSIPLRSIPLRSIPLRSIPLGSISLADLAVDTPGGWRALLDCADSTTACDPRFAGTALQAIPFASAIDLPQVQALDLRQLDFRSTPLGSIPLGSIALADVPLGSISLPDDISAALEQACVASLQVPCVEAADSPTLLSLALAGVPLRSIPLGSIPLRSIPLASIELGAIPLGSIDIGATPLRSIPLGSIPLGSIPLGSIPLGSIPLRSIPLGSIPLGSIPLRSIPLGSIPLGSIPLRSIPLRSIPLGSIPLRSIPLGSIGELIDCTKVDCTGGTLADAWEQDAFSAAADLAALGAVGVGTFADLAGWAELDALPLATLLSEWDPGTLLLLDHLVSTLFNGTTIAQLVAVLPPPLLDTLTLGGLLAGLLPRADYPWESVDLAADGIRTAAVDQGQAITYTATITVEDGPGLVELAVDLPAGSAYVPGSSNLRLAGQAVAGPIDDPSGTEPLRWALGGLDTGEHTVTFSAKPGLTLGPATTTASVTAATFSTAAITVEVRDAPDVGATPEAASPLAEDAINLSHIGRRGDVDLFEIQVPQGSMASISLSNLTFDGDLVLYSPDPALPGTPALALPPVEETVAALSTGETDAKPQTLDDVPRLGLPVYAVAAGRGLGDETINTGLLRGGTYFVQVSGYNGSFGVEPYALRAKLLEGPDTGACSARTLDLGPHGTLDVAALPADVNTIFLLNQQRFEASHPGQLAAVQAAVDRVAAARGAGVVGALVPVDARASVREAYAEWDTAEGRCSPSAANDIVRTIATVVEEVRAARPSVRNLVLIGADDQLPMGRVPDTTNFANERGFGPTLSPADEVSSSLRAGFVLTDDVYGDASPLAVGDSRFYVPDLAVGRLVHTPAQITAALERFVDTGGVIHDQSALVTGYDFLTDGARSISERLDTGTRSVASLVSDDWTRQDLTGALLPQAAPAPNIAAINAHFDPARALPAAGNATHDEGDLFTTTDVREAAGTPLVGRLLFSMGCHAGLNLSGADVDTWAKTFADEGALWVANTGYGYGDTETVALSELLMSHFAENLSDPTTVGEALTFAKHRFVAGLGAVGAYDMKSLMEATFYGLPMYRLESGLGEPAPAGPPTPPSTTVDPLTGLAVATVTVEPDFVLEESEAGDWYEAGHGTVAVSGRPLQPKATVEVTQPAAGDPEPGRGLAKVAHGALLTELTSIDVGGFTPRIHRPVVDLAENEAAPRAADVVFPSAFQSVRGSHSAAGARQHLVLVPGQFVSDPAARNGTGTQRLFERMTAEVLYAPPTVADFEAPLVTRTASQVLPGAVAFTVDAHDAQGAVERVVVLWSVADGATGPRQWQALDLGVGAPGQWSGGVAVPGLAEDARVEFLVQAVDAAGNVGVSTNKGLLFQAATAQTPSDLLFEVDGPFEGGHYSGPVEIVVSGASGDASYFLDGVGPTPLEGPVAVETNGVHRLEVTTTTGQRGSHVFVILADDEPPVIDIRSPGDGAQHVIGATVAADYSCSDLGGLGLASCVGSIADGAPIPTSTVGRGSLTVEAADVNGNQSSRTVGYDVVYGICGVGGATGKAGSTLQLELRVCNAAGGNLSQPSLGVTAVSVAGRPPDTTAASRDTSFKYNNGRRSYTVGLKTKGLAKGRHQVVVSVAGDAVPKTFALTLT